MFRINIWEFVSGVWSRWFGDRPRVKPVASSNVIKRFKKENEIDFNFPDEKKELGKENYVSSECKKKIHPYLGINLDILV